MLDFRTREGKAEDEPKISCYARKKESVQRMTRTCQKETESSLIGPDLNLG